MIILAFLVPLLLGVFVWRLLPAKSEGAGLLGNVFLAWGVGVGVASQIALYVTLASGRCIPAVIVLTGVGMMGLFWWLSRRGQVARHGYSAVSLVQALFVILAMWLLLFLAIHLPAGGYDAWSLWNYRAASIFIGWDGWTGVFHNQVQGKHPWLVPFFTVWGWSFAGQGTFWLPLLTAVFMATATVGLLVFAVGEERGLWWALLAGLLLLSVPFFTWHAVSQYASIFVAYYALAAVISFRRADSDNWTGWFILCGIFLGFLASS
ncbi:MAG: hypothetical protein HGA80_02835, partial [Candidatus Omnitrophica bacterium]|nr:hypothetical protein [Candidatus Omnitrophota bacterium]